MELNCSVRACVRACVCARERAIVRRRRSFWTASPGLGQYRSRFAVVPVFTNPSRPDSPRYTVRPVRRHRTSPAADGGGGALPRARVSLSPSPSRTPTNVRCPTHPLRTHILSVSRFLVRTWPRRRWSLLYAYVYIIACTYTYTCTLQHAEWMLARREF